MYEAGSIVELVQWAAQLLLEYWIPLAIVITVIPVSFAALMVGQYVWLRHKLSKSSGVRAPVISNTLPAGEHYLRQAVSVAGYRAGR